MDEVTRPGDELSFKPWKGEFAGYSYKSLWSDLKAGIEVALLTVPQSIAYAIVAGLPPSCGLYAAIFSSLIAALLGSSRFLIVGPVNAIAILMQAGTADILYSHYWEASPVEKDVLAFEIMTHIALLAGVLQMLVAMFKLGRFTQFVSHSVVLGYLAGSAVAIMTNQLFVFSGMNGLEGVHSLFEKLRYFFTHLDNVYLPSFLLGIGSLSFYFFLKKLGRRLPAAALMIFAATGLIEMGHLTASSHFAWGIASVGSTLEPFELLPYVFLPTLSSGLLSHLLSIAFAIALLSIIEVTCTSKAVAASSGQGISINQEILSVGVGNLVASCTGSMPVSVSNSRSLLNMNLGARTRLAAIFNVAFVAIMVGYLGSFVHAIPLPVLAALLFIAASGLINSKQMLLCLKSTRYDAFVMAVTFLACIFLNLDTAFYIGVVLSVALYLKKAAAPQLLEYDIREGGELIGMEPQACYLERKIRVIKVEGELFFGSADVFYETLKAMAEDDKTTRVLLLLLKNARDIDATACLSLMQLHEYMKKGGRHLVLGGMTHEMWDVMSHSGLVEALGKHNLFIFDEKHPQLYKQRAVAKAKQLSEERLPREASDLNLVPDPVS